jgi:hypothetical protein
MASTLTLCGECRMPAPDHKMQCSHYERTRIRGRLEGAETPPDVGLTCVERAQLTRARRLRLQERV